MDWRFVDLRLGSNNKFKTLTKAPPGARPRRSQFSDVKMVNISDLLEVLAARLQYFRSKPAYGLFFVDIYTVGGWF